MIAQWIANIGFGIHHAFHIIDMNAMLKICFFPVLLTGALNALAQTTPAPESGRGSILGTVLDVNGNIVPNTTITLECDLPCVSRTTTASDNAAFEFHDLDLAPRYRIHANGPGFKEAISSPITLSEDQPVFILTDLRMKLSEVASSVTVYASTTQIAVEQVHLAEQQRVLGFIPNFYVVYDAKNAVPLTTKLKFELALKVSADPINLAGLAFMAGVRQAAGNPGYVQGAKGYGQRLGAEAANGFSDILIGGAILPSLLHQDPRYFYQGTGTVPSRLRHALAAPFVCRGDNGRMQPNYSSIGGDLGATALQELYYPSSDRGAGMFVSTFAIDTAERELAAILQEFVIKKLIHTRR